MSDPCALSPDALAARYDDPIRRRNTIELDADRWATLERGGSRWGVGAFVRRAGQVLFVLEDGQWLLPGGVLEAGETHAEGAAREVHEETGIVAEIEGLGAIAEQAFVHDGRSFEFSFATFYALATAGSANDDPGLPNEGIERVGWRATVPKNTFDRDLVIELHRATIG